MTTALNIAQILLAIALITIILLQAGSSQLGGVFGLGEVGVPRKRRGLERTVFNLTIFLAVLFLILAVMNVIVTGNPAG
ncbi:MAG: preprotein translocase subunit SecG [Anaerolineae bacterium]|nr:preprotein translocase subunit SecG [Anaerolineae bacterium]